MDDRAVQLGPRLRHLVQQPGHHEGDRAGRWQWVSPEAAIPLAVGPTGADFAQDQVLAVSFINRYRAVAAGPGPAAIGVPDAQPEGQFRLLAGARVGQRINWALAPDEL